MKKLVIKRISDDGKQTLGRATLYDCTAKVFEFVTLEPAWENNEKRISCIPAGTYKVLPRISAKYNYHFHVQDVDGRSSILLHVGNYRKDSTGCILVGKTFADINKDGEMDITASKVTLEKLLYFAPEGFTLEIVAAM